MIAASTSTATQRLDAGPFSRGTTFSGGELEPDAAAEVLIVGLSCPARDLMRFDPTLGARFVVR